MHHFSFSCSTRVTWEACRLEGAALRGSILAAGMATLGAVGADGRGGGVAGIAGAAAGAGAAAAAATGGGGGGAAAAGAGAAATLGSGAATLGAGAPPKSEKESIAIRLSSSQITACSNLYSTFGSNRKELSSRLDRRAIFNKQLGDDSGKRSLDGDGSLVRFDLADFLVLFHRISNGWINKEFQSSCYQWKGTKLE